MPKSKTIKSETAAPRLGLLDGLRIVAALLVVLYHYTAWGHNYWGGNAPEMWPVLSSVTVYGQLGVQLFFLISGFVILMSLQGRNVIQFISSRIGRLYPAYWLAVIAAAILCFVIWPHVGEGRTLGDILPNLTMMQNGFGFQDLDGVYWTLWVELRFYVLLGVMLALGLAKDRYILILSVLWPSVGLLLHFTTYNKLQEWIAGEYAALFAAGMVLFLIHKQGHSVLKWAVVAFNTCVAAYFTGIKGSEDALNLSQMQIPAWHYQLIVILCVAALALVTLSPLSKIESKWLVVAGSLTYPLYLFHEIWGWWIINQLHPTVNKYVLLLGTISFMLAIAWLVARFVEKPLGIRLRNATNTSLTALSVWGRRRGAQITGSIPAAKYQQ